MTDKLGERERAAVILAELEQRQLQRERDQLLGVAPPPEPQLRAPANTSPVRQRAVLGLDALELRGELDALRKPEL